MELKKQKFGIEIEMTGITRAKAAEVTAGYFGTRVKYLGTYYDTYAAIDTEGRQWKFMSDSSITAQQKLNGRKISAGREYQTEMVSPICCYEDIVTIQEIIRKLKEYGALTNGSCGIHVHINAEPFDARTLRNITNIMASKEDLIYKALGVSVARQHQWCQPVEQRFLDELNRRKPRSMEAVERIWYNGESRRNAHYDDSRYHCLNLHSVFQKGTVEFRLFNGTLHAGKIKAYIQFCLAIGAQALNQSCASRRKTQTTNEKYTFRTWLLRLRLNGEEFATARQHLLANLPGCIAWRDPAQAEAQKERMRQKREKELEERSQRQEPISPTGEPESAGEAEEPPGFYDANVTRRIRVNRKPRLYVAYGSNLNLTQMAFRCPTAKVVGKGELKDYELLFRGGRRGAVATVEPKEGSAVPVLIWDIQKGDEESLDLYEGYPNFYDKQMIEVEMDGKTISAMVYVMTPGHSFGIPSDHYANVIWEGYETAGFDTQVLEDAIEHAFEMVQKQENSQDFRQQSLFGISGYGEIK